MKVALYARVSTAHHSQDPLTQLLPLRDEAQRRGDTIVEEFVDLGWSGAKDRRPNLDRMMQDARKKRFDMVLVWRFDRFARSTRHLLTAAEEFQKLGIHFCSLTERIDTSTPMGMMIFTILAAVAQMERELIRERVKAGVDRAKRQGTRLGRPSVLVDKDKIREQASAGLSVSQIAKQAGIARSTVRTIVGK